MSDGTRTRDILDHNQGLYQLSYAHHAHGAGGSVAVFLDGLLLGREIVRD